MILAQSEDGTTDHDSDMRNRLEEILKDGQAKGDKGRVVVKEKSDEVEEYVRTLLTESSV